MADEHNEDRAKPRRTPHEDLSRYEVFYGRDEFEREFERGIHKFSLVSREELRQAVLDALTKANESVLRRWHNISVSAAINADSPGDAEKEMRQILDMLRGYMARRAKLEKMLAHIESQYDEDQTNKGRFLRNAGVISGIIAAVVTSISILAAAFLGHHG